MTIEQKEMLDEEIETAMESGDENRLRRVMARYIMAIGDCQHKTSNRVKSVKSTVEDVQVDVAHIKSEMQPLKESRDLYMAECEQRKGAMWATRLIWVIVSACSSVGAFIIGRAM